MNPKKLPQYQQKQFYCVIILAIIALFTLGIITISTAFIWLPILIIFSPILIPSFIIFALIVTFTPLGKRINRRFYQSYEYLFYQSEKPRKFIWGFIYNSMCLLYPQTHWKAMNYGYAVLNQEGKLIKNLKEEDEEERFCFQLYHYIATKMNKLKDLQGLNVLEVGSGRGGGLNYISNYLNPKFCIGIDYSENQVRFCRSNYAQNKKIQFYQGDGEQLNEIKELKGWEFELALNIESSHCYGNFEEFLSQIALFVKKGGYLLFADFRNKDQFQQLRDSFINSDEWEIEKEEDITLNIVRSLKLDEMRKAQIIGENVHPLIQPLFKRFSGLEGSKIHKEFTDRETIYVAFVLKRK